VFLRQRKLQYHAKPDKPDAIFAKMLQEPLGGQWGEISVMMTYLFQGWSCRGPQKYRDMILDIATEEIGHVEMLATMIARLLESSPVEAQEEMAKNSLVGAMMGGARIEDAIVAGMNPQHLIVAGSGPRIADSIGNPWNAGYTIASGNLLADFRFNVTAESQGRLQVCRLYNMTEDKGVRDMLSFLIARDTMHQNQWLAAIRSWRRRGSTAHLCRRTSRGNWTSRKSPISSSMRRRARRASKAVGREGHP
jgi:Mn-containing catalase